MDKVYIFIALGILAYLIIATVINIKVMGLPKPSFTKRNKNGEYIITKSNMIETAETGEEAGFSVAYIMRHYGIFAKGAEIHNLSKNKVKDQVVAPKEILEVLSKNSIQAKYCVGSYNEIKNEIDKGTPVIAMLKDSKKLVHYVPVVGYDEENVYLAEAIQALSNVDELYYNREMKISEFKKLCNTSSLKAPLFRNAFIKIEYYNEFLRY